MTLLTQEHYMHQVAGVQKSVSSRTWKVILKERREKMLGTEFLRTANAIAFAIDACAIACAANAINPLTLAVGDVRTPSARET